MAGYATINAQFRPMSYQEMLAPVVAADTEHKAIEEQQEQLKTLSSQWEQKLAGEKDAQLRNIYQGYLDKINQQSNDLATNGLNATSRRNLATLKSQYVKDIVPIEEAYKRQQEELDTRKKLQQQDSSRIFEDGDLSITSFYNNPNQQFKSLSGNEVYQMAAKDFENYSKNLLSTGQWKSTAGGQYLERLKRTGATPEQVTALINKDPNAPKELKDLYSNIINNYIGRGNWGQEGINKIIDYVNRAASYAIGSQQSDIQSNKMWEWNMQEMARKRAAEEEAKARGLSWETIGDATDATNSNEVNTLNDYSAVLKKLGSMTAKQATEYLRNKIKTSKYAHVADQQMEKRIADYVKTQQTKNPNWNPDTDAQFKQLNAIFSAQLKQYGHGKKIDSFSDAPEKQAWLAITSKYKTNNIKELQKLIDIDIAKTTSKNRETALKIADPSHVNAFLYTQLTAGFKEDEINKRITDVDGKKLTLEERNDFFKNGRPGYDFKKKKLVMYNPTGTKTKALIDIGVARNMPIVFRDAYGVEQSMNGDDYLKLLQKDYEANPNDPAINYMINYFYDSWSKYARTFEQKAPETSK